MIANNETHHEHVWKDSFLRLYDGLREQVVGVKTETQKIIAHENKARDIIRNSIKEIQFFCTHFEERVHATYCVCLKGFILYEVSFDLLQLTSLFDRFNSPLPTDEFLQVQVKLETAKKLIGSNAMSSIIENHFTLDLLPIRAMVIKMEGSAKDIKLVADEKNHCSAERLLIFPETFPFYQFERPTSASTLNGSITGSYLGAKNLAHFQWGNEYIQVKKRTGFGNEAIDLQKSGAVQQSLSFRLPGTDYLAAILICYDFLNPKIIAKLTNEMPDVVFVMAAIAKGDENRMRSFVEVRGNELQCPIVFVSGENLDGSSSKTGFYYDPLVKTVLTFAEPTDLEIPLGKRLTKCPHLNWRLLFKRKLLPPFVEDFKNFTE